MSSRRTARVAQALLEQISSSILFELKDPRVKNVTVTRVEVGSDFRTAKVYVSVLGDEKTAALSLHGLNSAKGFLQSKLGDRLKTRYTPVLRFVLDPGIKRSIEASKLLREEFGPDVADNVTEHETEDWEDGDWESHDPHLSDDEPRSLTRDDMTPADDTAPEEDPSD